MRSGVLGSVHVLVVDDSPELLDVFVDILQGSGARVTAVGTAEQALALLEPIRSERLLGIGALLALEP